MGFIRLLLALSVLLFHTGVSEKIPLVDQFTAVCTFFVIKLLLQAPFFALGSWTFALTTASITFLISGLLIKMLVTPLDAYRQNRLMTAKTRIG